MERQLGKIVVRVVKGDICERDVGAIVNAANNALWMGGGVAGAIKRRGGVEIEQEAMAKGPITVGESIATDAGKLKARYVIHAAVMGQNLQTDPEKIRNATASALAQAEALGLTSIAFPALGTGVGGFPLEECAQIMRKVILDYTSRAVQAGHTGASLETVEFVLLGREAYETFARVLTR